MHIHQILTQDWLVTWVNQIKGAQVRGQTPSFDNDQANYLLGVHDAWVGDDHPITIILAQIMVNKVVANKILTNHAILTKRCYWRYSKGQDPATSTEFVIYFRGGHLHNGIRLPSLTL